MKISASHGIAIATLGLALASFSLAAHADCVYPKAPAFMPDGKTASEAEMLEAIVGQGAVVPRLECGSRPELRVHQRARRVRESFGPPRRFVGCHGHM